MKALTVLTVGLSGAAVAVLLWQLPQNLDRLIALSEASPVLSAGLLILWRILAIVVPPLPGGTVAFALIPILGWWQVYVYSVVGILAGASVAFFIARSFREPLTRRFVPLQRVHEWEERLSPKTKFLGFLGFRFLTSPVLDFVSYAAGITRLSFRVFFVSTLIVELPTVVVYYGSSELYGLLAEHSRFLGILALLAIGSTLSLAGLFWSTRLKRKQVQ